MVGRVLVTRVLPMLNNFVILWKQILKDLIEEAVALLVWEGSWAALILNLLRAPGAKVGAEGGGREGKGRPRGREAGLQGTASVRTSLGPVAA